MGKDVVNMSSKLAKDREPISYQALLDENRDLKDELQSLRALLEEAEELKRAISEGDLDALVIPGPEGETIFTLDSADRAYRVLVETMNEGTITLASDGTILYCNHHFAELLKMPLQAIIGTSIYRFIAPENTITFKALLKQEAGRAELNFQAGGGTSLPVYLSVSSLKSEGSPNAWCLVVTDLTKQKKNEEIVAAERLARSIIEQAAEAIVVCDTSGRITHFSNAVSRICRCDPTFQIFENLFENLIDVQFSEGEDAGKSILPVSSALKGSSILGVEAVFELDNCHKSPQKYHLILNSGPLKNADGKIIGCVVTLADITERKQLEEQTRRRAEELKTQSEELKEANEALHKNEERFRTLTENSPDVIVRFDRQKRHIYANPAAAEPYGKPQEEISGKTNSELGMDPEQVKFWEIHYEDVFTTGKPRTMEFHYKSPEGKEYYFNTRIVPEFVDGKVTSVLAISRDITDIKKIEAKLRETLDNLEHLVKERTSELKKAYNSLKESERGLAEAQKMAHIGNWDLDLVTGEVHWSNETYRIFGFKPQEFEVNFDAFFSHVHPEDRNYVDNSIKKALNDEPYSIDFRIISADGIERIVYTQGEVVFDEKKTPIGMTGTVQDITERKKAEEALELASKYNRSLIEASLDPLVTIGSDGTITDVNKATELITGYSKNELIRTDFTNHFTEPEKARAGYQQVFLQGEVRDYPLGIRHKEGHITPVLYNASVYKDASGEVVGIFAAARDITERKMAEETLAKIEKTRIKEIHHRIKNNLQVICSLLSLEADRFTDEKILEALRESQNRVTSMALIHEELYKGGKNDAVDFAAYLHKLTADLFSSYNLRNDNVSLKMDLEQIYLDMDTAIPLGIIVNELISNALKHAFPAGSEGEINISLCKTESFAAKYDISGPDPDCMEKDGFHYILTVKDDGKGIPEKIEFQNADSLGLQLVNILVEQIDGDIELRRDQGTKFTIWFNNI